jgi:hypothetical protein
VVEVMEAIARSQAAASPIEVSSEFGPPAPMAWAR